MKAQITYTARRSLALDHVTDDSYTIELDIIDAVPSANDVRETERSLGGATEPTFYRQDKFWKITFAPVRGDDLALLREFLDSTESGHAFRLALYGDEETDEQLVLKRLEDGHSEDSFMRVGSSSSDWFQASIMAIEAVDLNSSNTIDIYSPNVGGPFGGLGEVVDDMINDPLIVYFEHEFVGVANGNWDSNANSGDVSVLRTSEDASYSGGRFNLDEGMYLVNLKLQYYSASAFGTGNANEAFAGFTRTAASENGAYHRLAERRSIPNSYNNNTQFIHVSDIVFAPGAPTTFDLITWFEWGNSSGNKNLEGSIVIAKLGDVFYDL